MGLLDKSKNVSDESIYSVPSTDLGPSPTKEFHLYSNLKERFVQLWTGEDDKGPLVAKMGSNMWMTKFHFRDADGNEHRVESDSSLHSRYVWTLPSSQKLTWKTTRNVDLEGQKKTRLRRALKLVDEHDRVVAMFVYTKFAKRKEGKFIINRDYNDSREFEQGVLVSGLAILEVLACASRNAAASSAAASNASVAAAISLSDVCDNNSARPEAGFQRVIFGTSGSDLYRLGWTKFLMSLSMQFMADRAAAQPGFGQGSPITKVVAGIAANETKQLFHWQFSLKTECPQGCHRYGARCVENEQLAIVPAERSAKRFQVGMSVPVVWYIPKTPANQNTAESFNVTIALNGKIGLEISDSVAYPAYGDMDTEFIPDETWPESNNYQIFIIMGYGMKTLKSDKFGVWGGGKTPTPTSTPTLATSRARKMQSASSTTTAATTASAADASTTADSTSSSTPTAVPPAGGVSPGILGGAIGGAIVGTLAIVGLIWFMRKRMSQSRANHGQSTMHTNNGSLPPKYPNAHDAPAGNQPWPYQQMGGHSTTSVHNTNNDFKGYATANELPTQMHQEPVELYAMQGPPHKVEMMGDTTWHNTPPPPQNQPQKYVYSPASYVILFLVLCSTALVPATSFINLTIPVPARDALLRSLDQNLVSWSIQNRDLPIFSKTKLFSNFLKGLSINTGAGPAIRLGGGESDKTSYDPNNTLSISRFQSGYYGPQAQTNVTLGPNYFKSFRGTYPPDTKYIWCLNLINTTNSFDAAISTARGVLDYLGDQLELFEIGNEADFYGSKGYRDAGWDAKMMLPEWNFIADKVQELEPNITIKFTAGGFANPVYSVTKDFDIPGIIKAGFQGSRITLYTMHLYPQSGCTGLVTLRQLLLHDALYWNISNYVGQIAAAESVGAQFSIGETNTVSCVGRPGVSDTFAAALWLVDYALLAASLGIGRVYFHATPRASYSPILPVTYPTITGNYSAGVLPLAYGAYFVSEILSFDGTLKVMPISGGNDTDYSSYSIWDEKNKLQKIVVLNLEIYNTTVGSSNPATEESPVWPFDYPRPSKQIKIATPWPPGLEISVIKLQGPGSNSKALVNVSGFTFSSNDGAVEGNVVDTILTVQDGGHITFDLLASEAALLQLYSSVIANPHPTRNNSKAANSTVDGVVMRTRGAISGACAASVSSLRFTLALTTIVSTFSFVMA
ncbi:Beta-glucuronidase [Drechslerella dactyloides]|uniref:Beta-glucuronidase n=1 Tax=Drechslerella dactyloides TaxID=74499 RepID=A0AAD6J3U5_DREDA|nr:Beta-glucuronidase [Drechslerella dactyloides]